MKDKILMLIIGILIGAIIASAGFLIFGSNNKKEFDPSKFKNGDFTPPSFSTENGDIDFNNIDFNSLPEKPSI